MRTRLGSVVAGFHIHIMLYRRANVRESYPDYRAMTHVPLIGNFEMAAWKKIIKKSYNLLRYPNRIRRITEHWSEYHCNRNAERNL